MPPPSTPCPTCGKLFFAHSLAMHTAQCGLKMGRQLEGCPACGAAVPRAEMNAHLNVCKAAREMMGMMASPKKTPKKATTSRSASRGTSPRGSRPPATERKGKAEAERAEAGKVAATPPELKKPSLIQEPLPDGRVPCALCGRAFAPDRIIKHQFVCIGPSAAKKSPAGERVAQIVHEAVDAAGLAPLG